MRKIVLILSILLIGMMLTPAVTAQTSQNLEWEVEIGDQTFFKFYYWDLDGLPTFNENMYVNITGPMGTIPDPLADYYDIPDTLADAKWVNGTDMGMMIGILMYIWKIALPTGNWSLMTELVEDVTEVDIMETIFPVEPHVNIDNWYQWGFTHNLTFPGAVNVADVVYLKSDGSLAAIHLLAYEEGTSTLMGDVYMERDGTAPVISNPSDIAYNFSDTGNEISWSASDQSPAAYRILKDNVELKKGFWNSSSESIVVDVDGLAVGSYDYEIEFYEASGISASDVVTVTVNEAADTTTTSDTGTGGGIGDFFTDNLLLIVGVGGAAVIIIVIVIIIKKR